MKKFILTFCVLLLSFAATTQAQEKSTSASATTGEKPQTIFVVGVSQCLSDSIVYISDVTMLTGFTLNKGFLSQRAQYAQQFQQFVENHSQQSNQTTAILFAKTEKKIRARVAKLKKRLTNDRGKISPQNIREISKEQFQFQLAKSQ